MKWFLRLLLWVNGVIILLTVVGYLASYIEPSKYAFPQTVGLFMPWLLLINLIFAIFWLSLRQRWFWMSLGCLVLGFGQCTRFIGFHFQDEKDIQQLGICSFNSQSYNESDHLNGFLAEIHGEHQLDFICLQEITDDHLESLKKTSELPNHYFHKGKAILSKFPIISQGNIQFDQSVNGCIWIDVVCDETTIRIYNLHLKSNQVTREAETVLDAINSNRAKAFSDIRRMVSNYQRNSVTRKDQVDRILKDIDQVTYPMILTGDFNDTPFSYIYQQFGNRFTDQFKAKGLGIGSTYAGSLPGLKIDYIFADENFIPLDHTILKTPISDHFPVLSTLKIKK